MAVGTARIWRQTRALLTMRWTRKRRNKLRTIGEYLFPLVIMLYMLMTRKVVLDSARSSQRHGLGRREVSASSSSHTGSESNQSIRQLGSFNHLNLPKLGDGTKSSAKHPYIFSALDSPIVAWAPKANTMAARVMETVESNADAAWKEHSILLNKIQFIAFDDENEILQLASRADVTVAAAIFFGSGFGGNGNYSYVLRPNATWWSPGSVYKGTRGFLKNFMNNVEERENGALDETDPCKQGEESRNNILSLRSVCAGLLPLQIAIDESIISVVIEKKVLPLSGFDVKIHLGVFQLPDARRTRELDASPISLLSIQNATTGDESNSINNIDGGNIEEMSGFGIMFLLMLWPTSQSLAIQIVYEKKGELRDHMRVMGMTSAAYYMHWMLLELGKALINCIAVSIFMPIVHFFDEPQSATALEVFMEHFHIALTLFLGSISYSALGLLLSTSSKEPRNVQMISSLVFLVLYIIGAVITPYIYKMGSLFAQCTLSLLSPIAFAHAMADNTRSETFTDALSSSAANRLGPFMMELFLLLDTCLYILLAYLFDSGLPVTEKRERHAGSNRTTDQHHSCCGFPRRTQHIAYAAIPEVGDEDEDVGEILEEGVGGTTSHRRITTSELRVQGLSKTYYKVMQCCDVASAGDRRGGVRHVDKNQTSALHNISCVFRENECCVLLGPNGAGKSTLMSIITGIDAPDSGDVSICGETVHTAQQIPDIGIGLCPQKDILFSFLTVEEHTRLYASFRNDDDNIDEEVERILLSVGLWESGHRGKLVKDLSGGLKRRLTLALALVVNPKVLVFDEPTSGVDVLARSQIWELVEKSKKGRIVIFCTHSMDEAEAVADRIAIIDKGNLLCFDSIFKLKQQYGLSYELTITLNSEALHSSDDLENGADVHKKIFSFVKDYIPSATFQEQLTSQDGCEVHFYLPLSSVHHFPALFRNLEGEQCGTGDSYKENMHKTNSAVFPAGLLQSFGLQQKSLDTLFRAIVAEKATKQAHSTSSIVSSSSCIKARGIEMTIQNPIMHPMEGDKIQHVKGERTDASMKEREDMLCYILQNENTSGGSTRSHIQKICQAKLKTQLRNRALMCKLCCQQCNAVIIVLLIVGIGQAFMDRLYMAEPTAALCGSLGGGSCNKLALLPVVTDWQNENMKKADNRTVYLNALMRSLPKVWPQTKKQNVDRTDKSILSMLCEEINIKKEKNANSSIHGYQNAFDANSRCRESASATIPIIDSLPNVDKLMQQYLQNPKIRAFTSTALIVDKLEFIHARQGHTTLAVSLIIGVSRNTSAGIQHRSSGSFTKSLNDISQAHGNNPGGFSALLPTMLTQFSSAFLRSLLVANGNDVAKSSLVSVGALDRVPIRRAPLVDSQSSAAEIPFNILAYTAPLLTYGLIFSVPVFAHSIMEDKEKGKKEILIAAGVKTRSYWISNMLIDSIFFSFFSGILWLGLFICNSQAITLCFAHSVLFMVLFSSGGYVLLLLCYNLTFFAKTMESFQRVIVPAFFLAWIALFIYQNKQGSVSSESADMQSKAQTFSLNLLPWYAMSSGLGHLGEAAEQRLAWKQSHCDLSDSSKWGCSSTYDDPALKMSDMFDMSRPIGAAICATLIDAVFLSILLFVLESRSNAVEHPFKSLRRWLQARVHWEDNYDPRFLENTQIIARRLRRDEERGWLVDEDIDREALETQTLFVRDNALVSEDEDYENHSNAIEMSGVSKIYENDNKIQTRNNEHNQHTEENQGREGARLALVDVSLRIRRGEMFGLLGPNGAGKTTFLNIIGGPAHFRPSVGQVRLLGRDRVKRRREDNLKLGICPQQNILFHKLTVREHLQLFIGLKGIVHCHYNGEQLVELLLDTLGLRLYEYTQAEALSGGNARRLCCALSVIGNPSYLLLDEVSTGVDVIAKRMQWDMFSAYKHMNSRNGGGLLLTHSMEEAETVCDRIGVIMNGRLVALGTPQHIKSKYGAKYTIALRFKPEATKFLSELLPVNDSGMAEVIGLGEHASCVDVFIKKFISPGATRVRFIHQCYYYFVPVGRENGCSLSHIFSVFEEEKDTYGIVEYSVSQPNLDHVFSHLRTLYSEDNDEGESNLDVL